MHSERVLDDVPAGWEEIFKEAEYDLEHISCMLAKEEQKYRILPYEDEMFNAFKLIRPCDVRVVIVGQDPYPSLNSDGTPQTNGMAFSARSGYKPPGSLQNILKEIKAEYPDTTFTGSGDLSYWARQGVLLLNASLTVRLKEAGSHSKLWFGFLQHVINGVCNNNPDCIFMLWGKKSQELKRLLGARVHVLEAAHPSGLSANKGFFDCNNFVDANEILLDKGQPPIDWSV